MSEEFKKYKNKFIIYTALISAVCGISAGVAVCGVVWLVLKLLNFGLGVLYYAFIGVGVALVVGGVLFLIFKPSDMSVAKRLDKELNLDERLQTMVEFQSQESDMLTLQRQDAEQRLAQSPKLKPSFVKIAKLAVIPVLASAIMLTAAFVPAKSPSVVPDGDNEDVYEIDNWQIASLNQLIAEIRDKSSLREELKQSHVNVLEGLLDGLKQTTSNTAMILSVRSAITMLETATDGACSYSLFVEKFSAAEDSAVSGFADGLSSAAKAYVSGTALSEFAQVTERKVNLYDAALSYLSDSTAAIPQSVQELNLLKFKTAVTDYANLFENLLSSVEYAEGDGIAQALSAFISTLKRIADSSIGGGYSLDKLKSQVSDACTSYAQTAATEMEVQSYALMVTEYETNRLCAIFGIKLSNSDNPDDGGGSSNPDDDEPGSGGWGEGGVNYGSDDVIFFPEGDDGKGIYVQYGEVYNEYYSKVNSLLHSGDISEEAQRFIREYFTILNRGIKEDDASEN